jgi:tol-pal system protein YbgF
MLRPIVFAFVTLVSAPLLAPAQAQLLPPGGIPGGQDGYMQAQAQGQDAAGLLLRIDRLENQVRTLTGQVEQSQFQVKRLEDTLRKFQQDVELRFQDASGRPAARPAPAPAPNGQRRGDLAPETGAEPPLAAEQPPLRTARRGDAFDPTAEPTAPGAPRQLGTLSVDPAAPAGRSSGPYAGPLGTDTDPDAPLDLLQRGSGPRSSALSSGPEVIQAPPQVGRAPQADSAGPTMASIAPPAGPREEFDLASSSLKDGHYEAAETGFRTFLQKYPKDRLAADATFNLGESFYRRSRPREAAEQYFKVSTDFARSARAPEALIKLGLSLEKLGAREQACAAYSEVGRKYPNTSTALRTTAERESKRAQC